MPKLNGYNTLLELKKKWPAIKVLILSLINDEYAILRMLKNGAKGFLLKDSHPDNLRNALYEVYLGGTYFLDITSNKEIKGVDRALIPTISERQLEFLALCATDVTYSEIADKMGVSIRAIESIQQRLSEKLKISSRIGLVLFALKTGLIML